MEKKLRNQPSQPNQLTHVYIQKRINNVKKFYNHPLLKKKLPILLVIGAFVFFSYSLFSYFASKNEAIIIESGTAAIDKTAQLDFEIAALQYDDTASISEIALSLEDSALITPATEFNNPAPLTRSEIETYIVQPGDTISSIAENFGLKWSTVLWENNLSYWSIIKPGDELKILPTNGITHKVKTGETLSSIAQKYRAAVENIVQFNNLTITSILEPGEVLIIPDGSPPPAPKPKIQTPVFVNEDYSGFWDWWKTSKCHRFIARQCTSWVAYQWADEEGQCVPSWGHAKSWYYNAKRAGYETGNSPREGAIVAMTCTSWLCSRYGHVAYVESFDENTITISEMNGIKPRAYSQRTIENKTGVWQGGWKILGYIYPK
ncbi:LysM peptidoglycan-binding domain-containing protein [Patescibacteria group bacterium AH-259-L07]|nr:LysM peptidoglycan-binding domain-containing protein [Patescibacteria group bacterium AH-259-L07]